MSKKGRPFSAYLVTGADGKVGFEFEPKEPKPRKNVTEAVTGVYAPKRKPKVSESKKTGSVK
jgi:DNA topoisomerase-3